MTNDKSAEEIVQGLREMLPPQVDYAELVCAEGFAHGQHYVWEDPEPYVISAAADLIEAQVAEIAELRTQLTASQQEQSSSHQVKEWLAHNGFEDFNALVVAYDQVQQREMAAVEELRGLCWCCTNGKKWDKAPGWSNMTTCEHMRERGVLAAGGGTAGKNCTHWKWRGPQEAREKSR